MLRKESVIFELYGIIYCTRNITNDKRYIGQTTRSLNRRKKEHIGQANCGSEYAIHQAIRKYGADNFEWNILDHAHSQEELDEKEKFWIKYYNTFYEGGYNMATGGQSNLSDNPEELSAMRGGREFCVYDLDGNFIKEAISQTEFAKEIGVCVGSVNNVLKGIKNKNQVKGYILIFKEELTDELLNNKINIANKGLYNKEFYVFNKNNLEFMGKWDDRKRCSNELKVTRTTITRSLDLKNKNSRNKYIFYYKNEIPIELQYNIKDVI